MIRLVSERILAPVGIRRPVPVGPIALKMNSAVLEFVERKSARNPVRNGMKKLADVSPVKRGNAVTAKGYVVRSVPICRNVKVRENAWL